MPKVTGLLPHSQALRPTSSSSSSSTSGVSTPTEDVFPSSIPFPKPTSVRSERSISSSSGSGSGSGSSNVSFDTHRRCFTTSPSKPSSSPTFKRRPPRLLSLDHPPPPSSSSSSKPHPQPQQQKTDPISAVSFHGWDDERLAPLGSFSLTNSAEGHLRSIVLRSRVLSSSSSSLAKAAVPQAGRTSRTTCRRVIGGNTTTTNTTTTTTTTTTTRARTLSIKSLPLPFPWLKGEDKDEGNEDGGNESSSDEKEGYWPHPKSNNTNTNKSNNNNNNNNNNKKRSTQIPSLSRRSPSPPPQEWRVDVDVDGVSSSLVDSRLRLGLGSTRTGKVRDGGGETRSTMSHLVQVHCRSTSASGVIQTTASSDSRSGSGIGSGVGIGIADDKNKRTYSALPPSSSPILRARREFLSIPPRRQLSRRRDSRLGRTTTAPFTTSTPPTSTTTTATNATTTAKKDVQAQAQAQGSLPLPQARSSFPSLDPRLAAVENASRLRTRCVCSVCGKVGVDYPRCPRCVVMWCSRTCRMSDKPAGAARHTCSRTRVRSSSPSPSPSSSPSAFSASTSPAISTITPTLTSTSDPSTSQRLKGSMGLV